MKKNIIITGGLGYIGSELCKGITDSIKNGHNPVKKLSLMVKSLKRRIV